MIALLTWSLLVQEPETFESILPLIRELNAQQEPGLSYRIQVGLDPEARAIRGRATLVYKNRSPDSLPDLQFHLYMNAFSHEATTFAIENGGLVHGPIDEHSYGYIDIHGVTLNGTDLTQSLAFIQPDDGNPHDRTVARLPLPEPLAPDASIEVHLDFTTKLPRVISRTGFMRDTFFVAQWFPKLGVWETAGFRQREVAGWNCHQFHAWGEFYADFAHYEVAIEVPKAFTVGASGHLERTDEGITTRTYRFAESRIHDFAWLAATRIIEVPYRFEPESWVSRAELEAQAQLHGLPIEEIQLKPFDIHLFIQPEHRHLADRYFRALGHAIKYYGLWYGPYPYRDLTAFDPPYRGREMGGMEYPTLITLGTPERPPARGRSPESVTIHEFGHQYWYGMIGSNEFEESWLDEGFNTYSTGRVLDRVHSPVRRYTYFNQVPIDTHLWIPIAPHTAGQQARAELIRNGATDALVRPVWSYRDRGSQRANSYRKAVAVLLQLERELGQPTFARALRVYFQQYQFGHPSTDDFRSTLERATGRNLGGFFDAFVFGNGTIDYAVGEVDTTRLDRATGYRDGESGRYFAAEPQDEDPPRYLHRITIDNLGNAHYPVAIAVRYEDDREERLSWDGAYRWHRFELRSNSAIREVVIDPENQVLIDRNRQNNSYRTEPDPTARRAWSLKLLLSIQHFLRTLGGALS